jgi:hypothetical protein
MSHTNKIAWLLMAFALVALTACGAKNTPASPTSDPALVYTQLWQTVEAASTQTVLAAPPTATATITPAISSTPELTNTPLSTSTPGLGTPSATQFVLSTPKATAQQSCNNAQYVADVTYPDGTIVAPGEKIVKTWTMKNLGPCVWTPKYRVTFGWGADGTNWFQSFLPFEIGQTVNPGESIDLSVTLTAPTTTGDYYAVFRLQTDQWTVIGDNANFGAFSIKITVK